MPFWEKYNQIQTWVPGAQSTLYPGALPGLLVAGDPGIPKTLAPTRYKNFAPRIGLAYSPNFDHGFLKTIFGSGGKSSIRASYGIFYTEFPGLAGRHHVRRAALRLQLPQPCAAVAGDAVHYRRHRRQ